MKPEYMNESMRRTYKLQADANQQYIPEQGTDWNYPIICIWREKLLPKVSGMGFLTIQNT